MRITTFYSDGEIVGYALGTNAMTKTELARAFVEGRCGTCHNAYTDGQTYTLHKSPIVVKCGNQYQFYWHGYYTPTTTSHMNVVLKALGAPLRVSYAQARDSGQEVFVWGV